MRGFYQSLTEPAIASTGFSAAPFPGTLIVSRTHTRPGTDMSIGRETVEIRSDFGKDHFCSSLIDSWNRIGQLQKHLKRAEAISYLSIQSLDALIQIVDVGEQFSDEKAVMVLQPSYQCLF